MAHTMPRAKDGDSTQVSVMLPNEWVKRLDTLAARLSEPGDVQTRADVLRKCVRRGLEAVEAEHPDTKPRKRG